MNDAKQLLSRLRPAIHGLAFGLVFFLAASANAQSNSITNGDFEIQRGATNGVPYWTAGFLWGGPGDFEILDRTSYVQSNLGGYANYWSLGIRPATQKWCHAYFSQIVSNLTPNHAYTVSGYMYQERWKGVTDANRDEYLVYIEAIGGKGTNTPDGRAYVFAQTATQTDNVYGPRWFSPWNTSWLQFTNTQTPAADRTIEIRLHLSKIAFCTSDKLSTMTGYFDNIQLNP
jgi:hypothetical protein